MLSTKIPIVYTVLLCCFDARRGGLELIWLMNCMVFLDFIFNAPRVSIDGNKQPTS